MELFPPLTSFYQAIENDERISTTHVSLYIALLQQWNLNGGINPINVFRSSIMKAAKISARYTYNKCINNLQEYGYITYQPSTNPSVCSSVSLNFLK
ncbi:hypothetical protein BH10BAC2_BH10BAC2_46560 [soil metagenome]